MCRGHDLEKIKQLPGLRILPDSTQKKYEATWKSLRSRYPSIQIGCPPTLADLYDFFEKKFANGNKNSYLRTSYSHLNLIIKELYGEKLSIFPSLYRFINASGKQSPPVKKARPFEKEEFDEFFHRIDLNNKYQLVRACFAIFCYFGTNRVEEMKQLLFKGMLNIFYAMTVFSVFNDSLLTLLLKKSILCFCQTVIMLLGIVFI